MIDVHAAAMQVEALGLSPERIYRSNMMESGSDFSGQPVEDWSDLSSRLAAVLSELATRDGSSPEAILIISDRTEPYCFVQYACGAVLDGIWAEAANDKSFPKHRRYSREDKKRLRNSGWKKPGNGIPTWSYSFSSEDADPAQRSVALTQGTWEIAQMSVTALRDVMRIESPRRLTYDAFVNAISGVKGLRVLNAPEPLTLDGLGLDRKPSESQDDANPG